jgi:hypothetical protein
MFVVLDKETGTLEIKSEDLDQVRRLRNALLEGFMNQRMGKQKLDELGTQVLEEYAIRRFRIYSLNKVEGL